MNGLKTWNKVYLSTVSDMTRVGLVILNEGNWDGTEVMKDKEYFLEMVSRSQDLNLA